VRAQPSNLRDRTVGVVIVNWNTAELVVNAVRSCTSNGIPASSIVVVDQGSSDNSISLVKRKFRGVKVISLPENLGYASAVNAGATKLSTDFLIVANADVEFENGVVARLKDVAEGDERIAVVGPRLVDAKGIDVTRFSRTGLLRAILLLFAPTVARGWWRGMEQRLHNDVRPRFVSWVEGSFMLIRRSAFDEVGGFDESYSFFFEDGDIAIRLRELGFSLFHCPAAVVTHFGGSSFSQVPARYQFEFYKNCLLYYQKHLYRRSLWFKRLLVAGLRVTLSLGFVKTPTVSESYRNLLRVILDKKEGSNASVLPDTPLVSIIIATYGRVECLVRLLHSLKNQTYRKYEIIVVDQSDSMDRRKLVAFKSHGDKLRLVRSSRKNRCHAKNLGIRAARGELFLFLDDDIVPQNNLVDSHRRAYVNKQVGGVSCRVLEPSLPVRTGGKIQYITGYGRMVVGFQSDRTCFVGTLAGQNMSVPRQVQEKAGFFDVVLAGTSIFEEPDFSARIRRLGYKILFTNASVVEHLPQTNGNDDWKTREPALYYHWFHHNEILYFLRNHSRFDLFLVIPFCILRTMKQSLKFHMSIGNALFALNGVFEGFRTYYRLCQ
jgi:N-acetylglucosaminyl-diphospho-decaprenol L-rhamnosyltransferase